MRVLGQILGFYLASLGIEQGYASHGITGTEAFWKTSWSATEGNLRVLYLSCRRTVPANMHGRVIHICRMSLFTSNTLRFSSGNWCTEDNGG